MSRVPRKPDAAPAPAPAPAPALAAVDTPPPPSLITTIAEARATNADTAKMHIAVGLGLAYLDARVFELLADARVQAGAERAATLRRAIPYLEQACAQAEGGW